MIQYIIIDGNTGSHQFRNTPLHQFLRQLRVFQLVANSHTLSGPHQLRQIRIQGMMWKSRHLNMLPYAIRTFGLYDTQYFRTNHGVLAIHLVKVSNPE